MEPQEDIRWIQRYNSFHKAYLRIFAVVDSGKKPSDLSELEMEGLVQRFEYTFELAWKVLQDLLKKRGYNDITGPNPVLKKSLEDGLITDHDAWREMAKARNTTSHIYDGGKALTIVEGIYTDYAPLLKKLDQRLAKEIPCAQSNNLFE